MAASSDHKPDISSAPHMSPKRKASEIESYSDGSQGYERHDQPGVASHQIAQKSPPKGSAQEGNMMIHTNTELSSAPISHNLTPSAPTTIHPCQPLAVAGGAQNQLVRGNTSIASDSSPVGNKNSTLSRIPNPGPPHAPNSMPNIWPTTYISIGRSLDNFPADHGGIYQYVHGDISPKVLQVVTHRRSVFDFSVYQDWIVQGIRMCVGLDPESLKFLSAWTLTTKAGLQACSPPPKIEVPKVHLGHLSSTDVFGDDSDIPLYYIQLVQGQSECVKVVVSSSKKETAHSAFYEAFCGYSTVFICAICQSTRSRYQNSNPPLSSFSLQHNRSNARHAQACVLEDPMKVSVVY